MLVPVLARTLSVADFGRLEVLSVLSTTCTAIGLLGLDIVVTRRWADVDASGRRSAFATWMAITVAIGAAILSIALLFGDVLSDALFGTTALASAIRWTGMVTLANLVFLLGLTALRNQDRAKRYAGLTVMTATINGVLVIALALRQRDVAAVLAGGSLALTIGACAVIWQTRSVTVGRPQRAEAAVLVAAALPLVPGIALTAGGEFASRFIVLEAAGVDQVAYLSIALRFATIGLLLVIGFQLAWQPRAYAMAEEADAIDRLRRDARALMASLAVLAVGLAAAGSGLLALVAGDGYADALPALGWALLIPITTGTLIVATLPLTMGHQMRRLGVATAGAALTGVAVTIALAEPFGAAGAAAALSAAPLIGALLATRLAQAPRPARPHVRQLDGPRGPGGGPHVGLHSPVARARPRATGCLPRRLHRRPRRAGARPGWRRLAFAGHPPRPPGRLTRSRRSGAARRHSSAVPRSSPVPLRPPRAGAAGRRAPRAGLRWRVAVRHEMIGWPSG